MIFKSINRLESKVEKSFCMEQIQVYIRLVEVYCEKNNLQFLSEKSDKYIDELMDIGIIENPDEINDLIEFAGMLYEKFEVAVNFAIANKEQIGDLLDNLYNSKRKEAQEKADKEKKLTLVDFFCGAGGLSLGFLQEGFHVKLANDIEDVCIQTYKYNHPELPSDKLIQGDIKEIVDHIDEYISDDIDIVVGGPPCQGFSEASRNL